MLDEARSKAQLVAELEAARMRVAALERARSQSMDTGQSRRWAEKLLSPIRSTARVARVAVESTEQAVTLSRASERSGAEGRPGGPCPGGRGPGGGRRGTRPGRRCGYRAGPRRWARSRR